MTNIAFSFDDGSRDNYIVAKEILEKFKIPATFNITTGYISNKINEPEKLAGEEPMKIEELIELNSNSLFEIAGHGFQHNNNIDNLIAGIDDLKKYLNKKYTYIGIASPNSEFPINKLEEYKNILKTQNVIYLRTGPRFKKMSFLKKIIRKLNNFFNIPFFYYFVYRDTFMNSKNEFLLYSIPIIRNTKLKEVKYLIDMAIKDNKSIILMFHSISDKNKNLNESDLFNWKYLDFLGLCELLKKYEEEKKINLCQVKNFV